ncbi:MAG: WD40/YVTN/BNR-like repeat-containing protein [Chloroflexota bacterium]
MTIALAHGGVTMYASDAPSRDLMVGTMQGIQFLHHDGRGHWFDDGRALEGHHVHAFVYEPKSAQWFVGVYKKGIFASRDDGRSWEPRNTGLTEESVFSLAAVELPGGVVRLYAGTEPAHLFFSDDLGNHWTELPDLLSAPSRPTWRFVAEPFAAHLKHINVAPGEPVTVFASVEVGGLHRSRDGGRTFQELTVPHLDVHRTVIDPRNPNHLYISGGAGLFQSMDSGDTWEEILPRDSHIGSYPDLFVYAPSNPDLMFHSSSRHGPRSWIEERLPAGGQIARTRDGGQTWEACMQGLPSDRFHGSIEAMSLEECGETISLFVADTDGYVSWSADGGDSWQIIAQTAPVTKSVHVEMMQGGGPTPLRFGDGTTLINGVQV